MENYDNKNNRYRGDNQSASSDRDVDMNWDRNYNPGDDYNNYENGKRNVYSSDRESDYWNDRNRMDRRFSSRNEYGNVNNNRNNYFSYDRNDHPNYRSQKYDNNNSVYNRNRYENSRAMNDNYMGRPDSNNWRNDRYQNDRYQNDDSNWNQNDRDWWHKTKDEVASWFGDDDAERRRRKDEMQGNHRGKGPKNYTRSEERIREDVSDQFSDDSFLDASGIEVSVKDGDVTLNGFVDSRYSKHRAEDLAEDVTGVKNVQNNLRIHENNFDTIQKASANNGNNPITTNTNYTTSKNRTESLHG